MLQSREQTDFPRLLFPVVPDNSPSGGRKFVYHVVDFLNEAGFEAWVVHPYRGFRLTWFENSTQVGFAPELFPNMGKGGIRRIMKNIALEIGRNKLNLGEQIDTPRLRIRKSDVIVLPETRINSLFRMPNQCRKIVLNQSPYLTFTHTFAGTNFPGPDILGMIVLSKLNYEVQSFVFPDLKIIEAQLFIDDVFRYKETKKLQIAYMPRRGKKDALCVLNMLRFRGINIPVVPIDKVSHQEVAKSSKIP